MTTITVHKLDTQGNHVFSYTGEHIETLPNGVRIDARWTRPHLPLGYATFETGDHFIEWFYSDRWYNIARISSAASHLKGWYCNITAPASITDDSISYRDLLLDVWVAADGTPLVLDEDEFAADTTLDAATRDAARRAVEAVCALAASGAPPFERPSSGPDSHS